MLDILQLQFPTALVDLTMQHFSDEDLIRFKGIDKYKDQAELILKERFKAGLQRDKEVLLQNKLIDETKKEVLRAIDSSDAAALDAEIEALCMELVMPKLVGKARAIDLNGQGLPRIPKKLNLSGIDYLNLSNNQLTSLAARDDLQNIRHIDFSFNPITDFSLFTCIKQTIHMKISRDQFYHLPTKLQKELSLHNNLDAHKDESFLLILVRESTAALVAPVFTPMKRAAETEARAHASDSDNDRRKGKKRLRTT